jgi:DNA-binding NtrC family response regulator
MVRTMCILVSDDREVAEKLKAFGQHNGLQVQVYTNTEWHRGMRDGSFVQQLAGDVPALAAGSQPVDQGAKILPFPSPSERQEDNGRVQTINELEAQAIESAIHEFNGNLTEAAKALGIGRATLYRKVKQYNIDPSLARKRRVA